MCRARLVVVSKGQPKSPVPLRLGGSIEWRIWSRDVYCEGMAVLLDQSVRDNQALFC